MKTLFIVLSLFLSAAAFAASPILRGPGTTNTVAAWTNIVRNTASGLSNLSGNLLVAGSITNTGVHQLTNTAAPSTALTLNGAGTKPISLMVTNVEKFFLDSGGSVALSGVGATITATSIRTYNGGSLAISDGADYDQTITMSGDQFRFSRGINTSTSIATNGFFVPTNLPNAQIVDFFRPIVTTNASANITFTGVANLQPGMENQAIWKIIPDGTYTVSFPATWKNTAGAGSSYITTNGTHLHVLITAQMGVSTNVARLDYY